MKNQQIDTWDYQWTFTMWGKNWLSIIPNLNLVTNIGFGSDATHTNKINESANIRSYDMVIKKHPKEIEENIEADEYTNKNIYLKKKLIPRIINKLKKYLNEM
jgi:hypothetical protein